MTTQSPVKGKATSKASRESAPGFVHSIFGTLRKVFGRAEDERKTVGEPSDLEHSATWALTMSVEADEYDGGFVAACAEVPGAMGQGESEDEALHDLLEAINAIVAVRLEQNFKGKRQTAPDGARIVSVQL